MIEVKNLTKKFVSTLAVDNISFNVSDGEILGFLGPNGAGKTTTMRILTCFMPATSGTALVDGFDVFTQSVKVRKRIGYMPENVPLYPEMRVSEYLHFRAKLKGVPGRNRKIRVDEVIRRCRLEEVKDKIIAHLSKGYRQRTGLAECLVHDPKILILDEPTIGLDPTQIRETRRLIKDLGKTHTLLLSTHILPEVEMVCDRVVIINEGRIALEDTVANLIGDSKQDAPLGLEVKGPPREIKAVLESIPGVMRVRYEEAQGAGRFLVEGESKMDLRAEVFNRMAKNGWPILEMVRKSRTLEEIFVEIVSTEAHERGPGQ